METGWLYNSKCCFCCYVPLSKSDKHHYHMLEFISWKTGKSLANPLFWYLHTFNLDSIFNSRIIFNANANGVIYEVFCFKSVHEHINQMMKSDELVCTATEFFNIWKQRKYFESKDSFYGNISFVRQYSDCN